MKTALITNLEKINYLHFNKIKPIPGKIFFVTFLSVFKKTLRKQSFWGICLGISKKGINTNFILRNSFYKEGVTRSFFLYSPNIINIKEISNNNYNNLNYKSKLYYLKKKIINY